MSKSPSTVMILWYRIKLSKNPKLSPMTAKLCNIGRSPMTKSPIPAIIKNQWRLCAGGSINPSITTYNPATAITHTATVNGNPVRNAGNDQSRTPNLIRRGKIPNAVMKSPTKKLMVSLGRVKIMPCVFMFVHPLYCYSRNFICSPILR